jgi:predicted MFS family arabinose efflux permease
VYRRTGSAVGATAYFLFAQFVPALIAPALVSRVDRLEARTLLPVLYLLEGAAFLALGGWLSSEFELAPVLALTLADGVIALTARAISRATTVAVIEPAGLLREGNALSNAAFSVCFMAGPAIGGAVVAVGGTTSALFINAALFVAVALTIATSSGLPRPEPGHKSDDSGSKGRLGTALALAREQPLIRSLLGVQAVAVVFFTISTPIEIVLVQHSLHAGPGGYGALVSAWGAGSLVGSAVYARWRRLPSRTLITLGAALLGAGFIVMSSAPTLAIVVVGSAVAGVGNGVEAVALRTALQEAVERRWMAIIMSLNESIFQAMPGIGFALGGALAALAGPRVALAVGGAGSLLVMAAAWVLLSPSPDGHEPPRAEPAGPQTIAPTPRAASAARR